MVWHESIGKSRQLFQSKRRGKSTYTHVFLLEAGILFIIIIILKNGLLVLNNPNLV